MSFYNVTGEPLDGFEDVPVCIQVGADRGDYAGDEGVFAVRKINVPVLIKNSGSSGLHSRLNSGKGIELQLRHWVMFHVIGDQREVILQSHCRNCGIGQRQRLAFLGVIALEQAGTLGHLPVDLVVIQTLQQGFGFGLFFGAHPGIDLAYVNRTAG
jgi:hypothetical protein